MAIEPVNLDSELVAKVRELVGAEGVEHFIESAADRSLRDHEFDRILDELEAEVGPIDDELSAEADAFWHAG